MQAYATLKDGRRIVLRLKTGEDGGKLGEMLASCSARTYHFFHPYPLTCESGLKVAADEDIHCLVAVTDPANSDRQKAVGYAWIGRQGDIPSLGICVRDGWQQLGVGRALMEKIIEEARTIGKGGIQLTVMKDNPRALALYQSLGFVIDGDAPDPVGPSYHMTLEFCDVTHDA